MKTARSVSVATLATIVALAAVPHAGEAASCQVIVGTQDGRNKQRAIEKSRATLEAAIVAAKRRHGWKQVSVTPTRPKAFPLWKAVRTTVPPEAFLPPDAISDRAHSVCWEGVFSPAVCSSGARLCQISRASPPDETRED